MGLLASWGHTQNRLVTPGPVIVVGRKGTAGAVHWSDGPCWPIDTTYFAVTRPRVTPQFALLALQAADLPSICAQTGVPGLNRERAYEVEIHIPPLAEQRRIVDLIGAVDVAESAASSVARSLHQSHRAIREEWLSKADTRMRVG